MLKLVERFEEWEDYYWNLGQLQMDLKGQRDGPTAWWEKESTSSPCLDGAVISCILLILWRILQ